MRACRPSLPIALTGACLLLACAPAHESVQPEIQGTLTLAAHSSEPELAAVQPATGPIIVDHVWVSWELLRLYDCKGDSHWRISEELTADFANRATLTFVLPAEDMCGFSATFKHAEHPLPEGAPQALNRRSLVIEGHTVDGRLFTLASELTPTIQLNGTLALSQLPNSILSFDVGAALAQIDLASAEDDSGIISLTNSSNGALLAAFERDFLDRISLLEDVDHDARVSPADRLLAKSVR